MAIADKILKVYRWWNKLDDLDKVRIYDNRLDYINPPKK